jgi:hypothetical protein
MEWHETIASHFTTNLLPSAFCLIKHNRVKAIYVRKILELIELFDRKTIKSNRIDYLNYFTSKLARRLLQSKGYANGGRRVALPGQIESQFKNP